MKTLIALALCAAATHALAADADRYFVLPGRATVTWEPAPGEPPRPIAYTLRDYHDRPVATGQATVTAEGQLSANVTLAGGYYEIELPAGARRFGLVALPPFAGRPDPFFAIDSALSWLVHRDATREGLIRVLERSGIGMSRERLSWDQINPAADRWQWDTARHFDLLRQAYARHGVEVLEMFHNAPAWAGLVGKYPDDLLGTARAWQHIAGKWRPTWGALEIWNEPDIAFGGLLPADQYVPLVKAIAYGLAQARIQLPLVGGVFAHGPRPYLDAAAANGLADCVDAVSFHTYDRAVTIERRIGEYRAWLEAYGRGSLPLWITECGRPWHRGPDRPPADQDAASALDITMKAIEARACGIARHFPFVYPYYEEAQNNFGMMDRQATPLRAMAAYAQAIRVLAGKRYLGDLRVSDPAIKRARVFGDQRQTLCVLYTGRADPAAKTRLAGSILWAEGIDGRKLEFAHGDVPIADGLTYVGLEPTLGDRLHTDTPTMRLTTLSRAPAASRPAMSPIVLRHQFDAKLLSPSPAGYHLLAEQSARFPLTVRAFNLGPEPQELKLTVRLSRDTGRILDPPPRSVNVPAGGTADVTWLSDLTRAFAADDRLRVTVAAAGKPGAAAQLAFDLIGEAPLAQVLDRYGRRWPLPINDAARWRPAIARNGRMTLTHTPQGQSRLEAKFAAGDRWVYPQFRLPENLDLSRWSALVLRARCQGPATVRVFLWEGAHGVGYLTPQSIIPPDGKWHVTVVRFADLEPSSANAPDPNSRLDLNEVRRISIGMNTQAAENVLEFGDAHLVAGK